MEATLPEKLLRAEVGHLYLHGNSKVVAMACGTVVWVRRVSPAEPLGMGPGYFVRAEKLRPQPMKYFHGQVPL